MSQRFSASRALLGAGGVGPHPISLHFTSWIDTLNGGARHHGHSELPQRPPTHSAEVSSPWRPEIRRTDRADPQILAPHSWGVNGKPPPQLVVAKISVEKQTTSRPSSSNLLPLSDAFPSTKPPKGISSVIRSRSKYSQVPKQNSQRRQLCQITPSISVRAAICPRSPASRESVPKFSSSPPPSSP